MDEIAERERQAWGEVPSHKSFYLPDNGASSAQKMPSSEATMFSQESEPTPEDVWIVVMGMTGVGKSTLISEIVGHDVGVGHGLQSSK
jgi:predicted GTPase